LARESVIVPPGNDGSVDSETYFTEKANGIAEVLGVNDSQWPTGSDLYDLVHSALLQAQEVYSVDLTVYESDGKTVVGVYRASR
jgi:hypothetical protein